MGLGGGGGHLRSRQENGVGGMGGGTSPDPHQENGVGGMGGGGDI